MSHFLEFTRSRAGLGYPRTKALVRSAIEAALDAEGVSEPCAVEILLTDDETIHEINREHRGVDRATDVLSFPFSEQRPGAFHAQLCERDPESGRLLACMQMDLLRKEVRLLFRGVLL